MTSCRTRPTRRRLLALSGAALLTASAARAQSPALLRGAAPTHLIQGHAFATGWSVTLPAGPHADRRPLEELLAGIDRMMSPWRDDSEITGFNRAPDAAEVSGETAHVARAALRIAADSGGWFDPSVGPLVRRWGFGPIEGDALGWRGLQAGGDALRKDAPGLTMDLCGIAKGRALDLMAAELAGQGQAAFLLDLGGELLARGHHPSGRPWQVAIEDPRPEAGGIAAVVGLQGAIATSGTRAQSYDLGGQRHGHVIDPRRARPASGRLASVSVLADEAMTADGWATALAAAGTDGPALARSRDLAALFLFDEGAGGLRQEITGGFARHLL